MSVSRTGSPVAVAQDDVHAFLDSPARFWAGSWHAMQHVEPERLMDLQTAALRLRLTQLRPSVPVLDTLADDLGLDRIATLDDAVPLLFQHSVYKSYPASLLERNRFDRLTQWLDRLTPHDLSGLDVQGCDSIDSWLDLLDTRTSLRVTHSSGTAGTMSFIPRSAGDYDRMWEATRHGLFQFSDPLDQSDHTGEYFDLVWPLYRHGRSAIMRMPELAMPHLFGSPDHVHAMREGCMSADAMYLAGRLRAAAARGELDQLEINPALRERREQFERERDELTSGLPRFLEGAMGRLAGRRIWMFATWNVLHQMARIGLERGLERVFSRESLITTGGGAKGQVVPDDWEETVRRFTGVERLQHVYGMSEMTAMNKMCECEHYHFEPWIVPFVLDPEDGRLLPREGLQTGRMAFVDVLPSSHWGGFITGDEVTADWSPCACGRTTPHILRTIERYSDKRGDDKITCAAADEAHRAALDFLTERLA
jgi:hypothetical protein